MFSAGVTGSVDAYLLSAPISLLSLEPLSTSAVSLSSSFNQIPRYISINRDSYVPLLTPTGHHTGQCRSHWDWLLATVFCHFNK